MQTVLFGIYPAASHLNASFRVAHHLKHRGFRVVYAGHTDAFAEAIVKQGFEFVQIATDQFPVPSQERYGLPAFLASLINQWKLLRETNLFLLRRTMYDQVMREVAPDLLIVDALLSPFILMLLPYRVPVVALQTMFPTDKAPGVPPIHSPLVPDGSVATALRTEWAWWKYFAGRKLLRYVNLVRFLNAVPGFENVSLLKSIARLEKRSLDELLCFRRTLTFRVRGVAELVTSSRELDFPRPEGHQQYFLGSSIDTHRVETGIDPGYAQAMAELEQAKGERYQFLIYCAFGTMSPQNKEQFLAFMHRLLLAVAPNRNWHLVLAAGQWSGEWPPDHLPANVSVFTKVPQLHVLQKADLMITHGGVNSIAECVHYGVPMVVYPINAENDQNGNAARVGYHRLGVTGSIKKDSTAQIAKRIQKVLADISFKSEVEKMSRRVQQSGGFAHAMALLEASMRKEQAGVIRETRQRPEPYLP